MYRLGVETSGPLFDEARVRAVTQRTIVASEQVLAAEGVKLVRRRLDTVLKHPTGYYRSRIRYESFGSFYKVNDSNVIYGNWLERGWSQTRFRGYATFRKTLQELQSVSVEVLERSTIPRMVRELSG
jgi:hypothetical protein